MNRKASVADAIFLPIFITTIACTIFIAIYVWITFQTNFSLLVADTPHNATIVEAMNNISGGLQSFDYMFPFIVIGLLVISLIFAYKTGASVLYAFISIVLWGFAMLISALLTNIFGQFEVSFPDIAASLTTITFIMDNMKFFVLAWLFLLGIVMFTRDKKEEKQISASEAVWGG